MMKSFYKYYLFCLLISPFFYVSSIFFLSFSFADFFITSGSFRFFSYFPYALSFFIPVLLILLPACTFQYEIKKQIFAKFFAILTCFFFILFLTLPFSLYFLFASLIELSQIISCYIEILLNSLFILTFSLFLSVLISRKALSFAFTAFLSLLFFLLFHFDSFQKGLLDSRDVFFYLNFSVFFLFLAFYTFEKKRGELSPIFKKVAFLSFSAFFLIFCDSKFFYFKVDFTKQKTFSLSSYSKELLSEIDQPFTIEYYRSSQTKKLFKETLDIDDFLKVFAAESRYISYKVFDADRQEVQNKLSSAGIFPQPVRSSSKNQDSIINIYSTVVLTYLGQSLVIPFVTGLENFEYSLAEKTSALVRKSQRPIQVLFAYGNGDITLQSDDYLYLVKVLQSQGFSIIQTFLPSQSGNGKISFPLLDQIPLLLIGSADITAEDALVFVSFIKKGGKALVASSPFDINMQDWTVSKSPNSNLFYALEEFGIYFKEDSITSDTNNFTIPFTNDSNTLSKGTVEYMPYPYWVKVEEQKAASQGLTLMWPCAIAIDNQVAADSAFTVSSYLVTQDTAWQTKLSDISLLLQEAEKEDEKGPFNLAVSLSPRERSGDISAIFLGDRLSFSSQMLPFISSAKMLDTRPLDFICDSLLTLSGEDSLRQVKVKSKKVTRGEWNMTAAKKILPVAIVVQVFFILSSFSLMKVKRLRLKNKILGE